MSSLLAALRRSPTGAYIRTACYLWEQFARDRLTEHPEISGPTVEVFDSERYITGPAVRDPRWRVSFNGLGSISYCATVRRTEYLRQAIQSDVLGRTREFRPMRDGRFPRSIWSNCKTPCSRARLTRQPHIAWSRIGCAVRGEVPPV